MEDRKNCDVVRDLLPLYVDDVCTPSSRQLVAEHLSVCGECSALERKLRNTNYDRMVSAEAQDVLQRHAKKEKGAAWRAGMIMSGIMLIPILILAVVTAAGAAEFGSLLVVISSMMLAASFIVVPLFSKKERFIRIAMSATGSILLVEFFGCLIDGESFARAAVPTLFGLSVVFLPFVIRAVPLPDGLRKNKAVTVITWDCFWLFLTIAVENLPPLRAVAMSEGMVVSAFLMIVTLSVFGVMKLSNSSVNPLTKCAAVVILLGLWGSFVHEILRLFREGTLGMIRSIFDPATWSFGMAFTSIILTILSTVLLLVAVGLIAYVVKSISDEQ